MSTWLDKNFPEKIGFLLLAFGGILIYSGISSSIKIAQLNQTTEGTFRWVAIVMGLIFIVAGILLPQFLPHTPKSNQMGKDALTRLLENIETLGPRASEVLYTLDKTLGDERKPVVYFGAVDLIDILIDKEREWLNKIRQSSEPNELQYVAGIALYTIANLSILPPSETGKNFIAELYNQRYAGPLPSFLLDAIERAYVLKDEKLPNREVYAQQRNN